MKKLILMVLMICATIALTFSGEIPADKASTMTYQTATILKIYDAPNSFFVMYQSDEWDIAKVAFPKEWFSKNDSHGELRSLSTKVGSFMTIFYKDGKFSYVKLSVPPNRANSLWGVWKQDNLDTYMADESFIMQY